MKVMYESKLDVLQQTSGIGFNALHYAASKGHVAAVNQLLAWDLKLIDARNKVFGMTPFIKAAAGGHVDVLKALYAKGGEDLLTQKDNHRWTPLHYAAVVGESAVASQLLEWGGGALLDIKNNYGDTPWGEAKNRPEIRKIMEKYKR